MIELIFLTIAALLFLFWGIYQEGQKKYWLHEAKVLEYILKKNNIDYVSEYIDIKTTIKRYEDYAK